MKQLINNQRVKFDSHDAGSGQAKRWGDGIHMHKYFLTGRRRKITIKIPIDSNAPIEFGRNYNNDPEISQIRNEIRRALRPGNTRQGFIKKIVNTIETWLGDEVTERIVRNAARQIAKEFDLKQDFEKEVISYASNKHIINYTSFHFENRGRRLYRISQGKGYVAVGSAHNPSRRQRS